MIDFLTKDQVTKLTGKSRFKAQAKALRQMGVDFRVRPDGRPMVVESDITFNKNNSTKKQKVELNLSAI